MKEKMDSQKDKHYHLIQLILLIQKALMNKLLKKKLNINYLIIKN